MATELMEAKRQAKAAASEAAAAAAAAAKANSVNAAEVEARVSQRYEGRMAELKQQLDVSAREVYTWCQSGGRERAAKEDSSELFRVSFPCKRSFARGTVRPPSHNTGTRFGVLGVRDAPS